jgi:hypothetical protein
VSGRPFLIITGDSTNFQFAPTAARPNEVTGAAAGNGCGPLVASKSSPTGLFQEPCFTATSNPALLSLDGDLACNAGVQPWTVFNDLRIARRVYFRERISLDLITDMFNLANKFNVASVNQLWTNAGQPTAGLRSTAVSVCDESELVRGAAVGSQQSAKPKKRCWRLNVEDHMLSADC